MSQKRRAKRRQALIEQGLQLLCLFFIGFMVSSFIGLALMWALGIPNRGHGDDAPVRAPVVAHGRRP